MIRPVLIGLALLGAPLAASAQNAKELAQDILTKGAALFDKCDGAAMAATYVEDAESASSARTRKPPTTRSRTTAAAARSRSSTPTSSATATVRSSLVTSSSPPISPAPTCS